MRGPDVRLLQASLELPRLAVSHVRRQWWRRMPPIPTPAREHLAWRVATAYGGSRATPAAGDVIEYAAWRRRQRRASR